MEPIVGEAAFSVEGFVMCVSCLSGAVLSGCGFDAPYREGLNLPLPKAESRVATSANLSVFFSSESHSLAVAAFSASPAGRPPIARNPLGG